VPPADADAYTFVDDSAVTAWEEWTIRQRFTVGIALLAVAVVMFGALTPLGDSDKQTPTSIPFSRPPAFPLPLTQTRSDAPFTDEAKATVARAIERTRARGTAYYEHFAVVEGWRSVNGDGPCLGANTVRLSDGDVDFGAFALRRIGGTNRTAESIVTPHHVCSRRTGADGVAGPWYYAAPLETDSLVALRQFGSEPRFLNEWNNALPTASLVGLVGPDSIAQRLDADLVDGADVTRWGIRSGGPEPQEATAERPVQVVSIDSEGLVRQVSLHRVDVRANGTATPAKGWLHTRVDVVNLRTIPGVAPIVVPDLATSFAVPGADPGQFDDAIRADEAAAFRDRSAGC